MVDPNNSMDNYLLIKVSKWLMDCKYKDDMMKSLPESTLTESVQNF